MWMIWRTRASQKTVDMILLGDRLTLAFFDADLLRFGVIRVRETTKKFSKPFF